MVLCYVKGYGLMLSRRKWFDVGSSWVKKYGSMLGKRKWLDAGSKGMFQCWIEGDGVCVF